MPYITWTDSSGVARLDQLGLTFTGWTPDVALVGPRETALATGAEYLYELRQDEIARFRFTDMAPTQLALALRVKRHLLRGGQVTVYTEDLSDATYDCTLAPGTTPTIEQEDGRLLTYALELALRSVDGSPLLAVYEDDGRAQPLS